MLLLHKPSPATIHDFLVDQARLDFTYPAVGATAVVPPKDYVVDRSRIELGKGEGVFRAAQAALKQWEQFHLGWVEASPRATPIQTGKVVIVVARTFGLWWLNACRVVYVVDEIEPIHRFGFAYGTLPGHAAKGEERFLIEWDRADDRVWYEIFAFSRPKHLLTYIGYPMVRSLQERFRRESSAVMQQAVVYSVPIVAKPLDNDAAN